MAHVDDGMGTEGVRGIDLCTGDVVMDQVFGAPIGGGDISFRNAFVVGVSPDGSRVSVWESRRQGTSGVATVDVRSLQPEHFLADMHPSSGGITYLPSTAVTGEGSYAMLAWRGEEDEAVYVVDRRGAVVNSVTAEDVFGFSDDLWQVLPALDGESLIIAGESMIASVRLPDLEVEWIHDRVGRGVVATAGDSRLLLTDGGRFPDDPGSGYVFLLDTVSGAVDSIDVSDALGGVVETLRASVTLTAVVDQGHDRAFIVSGTPPLGPTYPVQPPAVIIVDLSTRKVESVVDVSHLGLGRIGLSQGCASP